MTGVAGLGFLGFRNFVTDPFGEAGNALRHPGYGPLLPDPKGILKLPQGFSYRIISRRGDRMDDGLLVPGNPDGMAAFAGPHGKTILVRNHENKPDTLDQGAFGLKNELLPRLDARHFYDYGQGKAPGLGGTTTLVYDHRTGTVERQFLSLAGTSRNCAGGPTPWGSYISCEETSAKPDGSNFWEKAHGYNFEVPASTQIGLAEPLPIKGMGRFTHEAVAVDPRTSIVYMTEDRSDGLIYRYIPHTPEKLLRGGTLQALVIRDQRKTDTRNWPKLNEPTFPQGERFAVEWLTLDNVESPEDDLRYRGHTKGAAVFARGEGMWFGNQEVYFACTNGGRLAKGQVFRYMPSLYEGTPQEKSEPGHLELFVEPNNQDLAKHCDSLTVAPWGDVILCEDHKRSSVVGVTPQGDFSKLAENTGFSSEFSGGVFSPSGETYFVNLQAVGLTLAITGPWGAIREA
ncbi:PhoX family phosphatase [soil metagenome]